MGMGGSQPQGEQPVAIKAVQVQTSSYGVARPMVYGTTRVSNNLVWYGDFFSLPVPTQTGGK